MFVVLKGREGKEEKVKNVVLCIHTTKSTNIRKNKIKTKDSDKIIKHKLMCNEKS